MRARLSFSIFFTTAGVMHFVKPGWYEAIMPDYYLVLDPGSAHTAWRHWWCGALGRFAPKRVLPAASPAHPGDHRVRPMLGALPSSRPWPEPASWLREVPFAIPDRVGLRA